MCGIVGFSGPPEADRLNQMISLVRHRGPDETGKYSDNNVSLGHARLKIIDLHSGRQPIHNRYENLWVVFNGEIYNFKEIREELEADGFRFYTQTDTEVIVNGYERWGVGIFERLHGCFAIAIWDRLNKQLILARDRLGIKPLYYAVLPHRFVFASEIKALLAWDLKREVDKQAFREFLTFQYCLGDNTLFKGVKSVLPGHYMIFSKEGLQQSCYWNINFEPRNISEQGAIALLQRKLAESVKERTVSDVPIGAFLSGGLDSSFVVGLLSRVSEEPVRTFSVGFGEQDDELKKARTVADAFKTDHKEMMVEASPHLVPEITWHSDLPVVNIAALPTYLMAQATKPFVSVVLTGDGGDEMFAGYQRYERVDQWHAAPTSLKRLGARTAARIRKDNPLWQRLKEFAGFDDQAHSFLAYQASFSPNELKELTGKADLPRIEEYFPEQRNIFNNMFTFDTTHLLPNDYLMKVDRMTMAHGLEARVPFLDHRVAEFSAGIHPHLKMAGGKKYLLKAAMRDFVPDMVLDQKKQGFNVPTAKWLKGELGEIAAEALSSKRRVKLFKPSYVKKVLSDFQRHSRYYSRQFWTIYSFQVWWDMFIKPETLDLKSMSRSVFND